MQTVNGGGGFGTRPAAANIVVEMAKAAARCASISIWLGRAGPDGWALSAASWRAAALALRSGIDGDPDNELAARSNGVDVARIKLIVYVVTAAGTAMIGALVFLQKLRISPDIAFSVNDWTAFVIFITVNRRHRTPEGPTRHHHFLHSTPDAGRLWRDLICLMLGAVAILVMLKAPALCGRYPWPIAMWLAIVSAGAAAVCR